MAIDIPARIEFLKKLSLFYGLEDIELEAIAKKFVERNFHAGAVIYKQDDKTDSFYAIYSGKVRLTRKQNGKETTLAVLEKRDHFGEGGLSARKRRAGTITAVDDTIALEMNRKDFEGLFKKSRQLHTNLHVAVESRKLARKQQFKWLAKDESIYFVARKHSIMLYARLILPVLTLSLPLLCLYGYYAMGPYFLLQFFGISSFIAAILWIIWTVIDWGNDYYIVTNNRAIWLEKVIGIYDSRQETPLSMITSIDVESSQIGRILDYGDIQIRTFVGQITFNAVNHPKQARHIIEEYWSRSKDQTAGIEKDAMKNAIRKQLGLLPPQPKSDASAETPPPSPKDAKGIVKYLGKNRLKLHYESGDTVVYRKHWLVLFRGSWLAFTGTIMFLLFFVFRVLTVIFDPALKLISFENGITVDTWAAVYLIAFIPFAIWALYVTADWSNDRFEINNEQIVDTNKKPLGTETRKVSQLENILGTSYERQGFLGNMFNYGTVHIAVGGSFLDFENVADPGTVQSDIDRRRMAFNQKQAQDKVNAERDRMASWLAAYHKNAKSLYKEEEEKKPPKLE